MSCNSIRGDPNEGGCTMMPPAAISPIAMMTPDAERTFTHVRTLLLFIELLRK
jgi:hypothetical protein